MNWPFWSRRRPTASDFNTETCDGIEPLLSLYADGMAAPEESRRVAAHLATCADCRESLAWMQATHRALASRPIVAPPANLQARIAEAIAASSAAPIRLSPARAFTLRPAYAAAASLIVLGVALSVSLLSHPASTEHPQMPTVVAVNPNPPLKTLAPQKHTIVAQGSTQQPHVTVHSLTVHPTVRHEEQVEIAVVPTTKHFSISPPKRNYQVALVTKRSSLRAVPKAIAYTPPKPVLLANSHLANTRPAATEHTLPPVTSTTHPPIQEATVPQPTVPVSIGPATVTTQPETPRIQLASDVIMGDVRTKVLSMHTARFATIMKSASHTALNLRGNNVSDAAVQSMISIPMDH